MSYVNKIGSHTSYPQCDLRADCDVDIKADSRSGCDLRAYCDVDIKADSRSAKNKSICRPCLFFKVY